MNKPPPLLTGTAPGTIKLEEGTIVGATAPAAPPPAEPLADEIPERTEPPAAEPPAEAAAPPAAESASTAEPDGKAQTTRKRAAAKKPARAAAGGAGASTPRQGGRGAQRGVQAAAEVPPPAPAAAVETVEPPAAPRPRRRAAREPEWQGRPQAILDEDLREVARTAGMRWASSRDEAAARFTRWSGLVERLEADALERGMDPARVERALADLAAESGAILPAYDDEDDGEPEAAPA